MSGTTDVLQATGSLVQAGCAIVALLGLFFYTRDNNLSKNATLAQNKASRRPFFVFAFEPMTGGYYKLIVVNIGSGHALRFRAFRGSGQEITGQTANTVVPAGQTATILTGEPTEVLMHFALENGVRLEFEDMAGTRYWSAYRNRQNTDQSIWSEDYIFTYGEHVVLTTMQKILRAIRDERIEP